MFPNHTTPEQSDAMARLEKVGFYFQSWTNAANPLAEASGYCDALMTKKTKHGSEYREVEPDGSIH